MMHIEYQVVNCIDPVLFTPSGPQNCPIRVAIDLHVHVWKSVHVIYHIWVTHKSLTDQNFGPQPPVRPLSYQRIGIKLDLCQLHIGNLKCLKFI